MVTILADFIYSNSVVDSLLAWIAEVAQRNAQGLLKHVRGRPFEIQERVCYILAQVFF